MRSPIARALISRGSRGSPWTVASPGVAPVTTAPANAPGFGGPHGADAGPRDVLCGACFVFGQLFPLCSACYASKFAAWLLIAETAETIQSPLE